MFIILTWISNYRNKAPAVQRVNCAFQWITKLALGVFIRWIALSFLWTTGVRTIQGKGINTAGFFPCIVLTPVPFFSFRFFILEFSSMKFIDLAWTRPLRSTCLSYWSDARQEHRNPESVWPDLGHHHGIFFFNDNWKISFILISYLNRIYAQSYLFIAFLWEGKFRYFLFGNTLSARDLDRSTLCAFLTMLWGAFHLPPYFHICKFPCSFCLGLQYFWC